jgi:dTDP-glucose pyrophosphorylase
MQFNLNLGSLLVEAIEAIEKTDKRIAVVIDEKSKLVGTITDGDVRRSILAGGTLQTPVKDFMNSNPVTAFENSSKEALFNLMKNNNILAIPLVNKDGKFIDLSHISEISQDKAEINKYNISTAVIMAGGLGMRLRPITENIPKPMVDIGGMPLLERQIKKLSGFGIQKIYLAVNYLSEVIESHFNDGSKHGVEIHYLKEKESLGTGGALSLLPEKPDKPFLVMNGDVLTNSNFQSLSEFHFHQANDITIAGFSYNINIPFGVIDNNGPLVQTLQEKPSENFLCNAGIYILSPKALEQIPHSKFYNMTDLVNDYLGLGKPVSIFPIHEYWSDIGTSNDLDNARKIYTENKDYE